jgi:hypothetical protein
LRALTRHHTFNTRRTVSRRFATHGAATLRIAKDEGMHSDFTKAVVRIEGQSPLSQSRQHDEQKLEGETHDDYDRRTWRAKLNVADGSVIIPAHGMMQAITAAARYSKRQIPGQGKATWTKKFEAGIVINQDILLNIDPATVGNIVISANADGVRGSGKRVVRRFPIIPPPWFATFEAIVLDPIITEPIFTEMLGLAGVFIGCGRFRPEKGGTNGRFRVADVAWHDARQKVAA